MKFKTTDIEVTISEVVDIAELQNISTSPELTMDTTELTQFITENSERSWNEVCDFLKPLWAEHDLAYGTEFSVPYFENPEIGTVQEWVNFFYEAYGIEEYGYITFKFTN